ncbi:MAG: J domain-containing protein [Candidatus Competibacteraceae bacterium]
MKEDLIALAIATYEAPIAYQNLWNTNTELTESMHPLLLMAGSETDFIEEYCSEKKLSKKKLQEAITFFIKQVLFVKDASYYRTLGLNPDASQEQIKENYRLLIRLFHPDR